MDTGRTHNPFSSEHVEPARGGYIFTGGESLPNVLRRLQSTGWRGHLVGPHGAGKSTLLTDILSGLPPAMHPAIRWQCSDERRGLPRSFLRDFARARLIAIDGAERLYPGLLPLIRLATRAVGKGLIVTLHNPRGPGCQVAVRPDPHAIIQKIQALHPSAALTLPPIVHRLMEQHRGNARAVLFDLYLIIER